MLDTTLPKIECEAISRDYGRFTISPLEGGFGITLGNALRRVLLSSLPGAAVTSIKINDVYHEFSPIPHAREDTTRLILNLKKLRLKSRSDDSVRLRLEARGEGVITAGDIQCPSEVEIINPELPLLTLASDDAELDMELVVQRGKGYSPAEERGKLPIGEIPVDAIFSPIRKVNYTVKRTRVGRMTDYDHLTIEVWTDGTIHPREALSYAAQLLVKHFSLVASLGEAVAEEEVVEEAIPAHVYETLIDDLDLSVRAYNCLKRAGITKVGEVLERLQKGDEEILVIRNFGKKSLEELKEALRAKDFLQEESEEEIEAQL
ncbi:MAG: DNA-directed RNA polymerase subunit alpha [Anaerolineae bacterium]